VNNMNPWTKVAAIFSVLASLVTIYNVAVRPKDAPPMWNSVVAAVGMGGKTVPAAARNCARVRKPVWPESSWSVRVAPGTEQQGLGASLQGWAPARAVDKGTCGKA
jgi:hypothetical protein